MIELRSPAAAESGGARKRTQRAILEAALDALARNPNASVSEIAALAQVGRTTVHRYFPERADLISAIGRYAQDRVAVATTRARLDEGSAPEALSRLTQEYFEFGKVFMLQYTIPDLFSADDWDTEREPDRALIRLIERGHSDGTIDPALDPQWIRELLWALLYAAWELVRTEKASRHRALDQCLRALGKAIAV